MRKIKVAVDGPAGAGKSTISKKVAERLNLIYIDTGAMYRAVGLYVLRKNISTTDNEAVSALLNEIDIDIAHGENGQLVFLNGEDVTGKIRTPEVSMAASNVSAIPEVRIKLVEMQRALAESKSVIMDGRDIGSHVLPDADIKIFLTASVEERARRRYIELTEKGEKCSFDAVKEEMELRDKNDSTRAVSPLIIAEGAVVIDTTNLTPEQSIDALTDKIKEIY